jgi:CelD/BcsL family acetyltransferase involved in cellulose biosynthesis
MAAREDGGRRHGHRHQQGEAIPDGERNRAEDVSTVIAFDFLIGNEGYKFQFATHNRVIGEVGSPPVRHLVTTKTRAKVKSFLENNPRAKELFQKVRALAPGPRPK